MRSSRARRAAAVLGLWGVRLTARLESIAPRATLFVLLAAVIAFAPAIFGSFHLDDYSLLGDPAFTNGAGALEFGFPLAG